MADRLHALNNSQRWDFSHTRNPICPHCRGEFGVSDNEAWFLYDDSETHEVECPSCALKFTVQAHSKWTFSTDEQDDDA